MNKDYIRLNGTSYRVEVNWNTIIAFLKATNQNNWAGLTSFSEMTPSDIAPLMAAAINEGERLEGREANFTGEMVGTMCDFSTISEFLALYQRHTQPESTQESKKKD